MMINASAPLSAEGRFEYRTKDERARVLILIPRACNEFDRKFGMYLCV